MEIILRPLLYVFSLGLDLLIWCLIISVVLGWLSAFGIINNYNRFVVLVSDTLYRLTEPLLRPIRSILPAVSGVDFSPLVLALVIAFLQRVIGELAYRI